MTMVMVMVMNERTTPTTTKWVNKDVSFTRNSLSFLFSLSNLNAPRGKLHAHCTSIKHSHTHTHIGQIDRSPSTIENVTFVQTRCTDCELWRYDDDDDVFFYSDDVIDFFFRFCIQLLSPFWTSYKYTCTNLRGIWERAQQRTNRKRIFHQRWRRREGNIKYTWLDLFGQGERRKRMATHKIGGSETNNGRAAITSKSPIWTSESDNVRNVRFTVQYNSGEHERERCCGMGGWEVAAANCAEQFANWSVRFCVFVAFATRVQGCKCKSNPLLQNYFHGVAFVVWAHDHLSMPFKPNIVNRNTSKRNRFANTHKVVIYFIQICAE